MFTGIIETIGTVKAIEHINSNTSFWIESSITTELKIDQSIAHNGVCLTVEAINQTLYKVTAVQETLNKTNLSTWQVDSLINLERCMPINGRLDGHIVQGHVDATAVCKNVEETNGSWLYSFKFHKNFTALIIEKGSVCINGISLTCFNTGVDNFSVAIIPYTYQHTNIHTVKKGDTVNIEFDVLGKYVQRMMNLRES